MDITRLFALAVLLSSVGHVQIMRFIFVILSLVLFKLENVLLPLAPRFVLVGATTTVNVKL